MSSRKAEYNHTFPAVRGVQAGRPCYIAMCPMRLIPRIFLFDEDEVPPELRAQRTLNHARIPEMAEYLTNNLQDYTLSAITASVDAVVEFEPMADTGHAMNIGILTIPMDAQILINDGQHRRAAIEEAVKNFGELGHDSIPVLFFIDEGLKRSQQMFADLNKHAVRPSNSLSTLYDRRDPGSEMARHVVSSIECFKKLTELEKSSLSNRSIKLFTLSSIKLASRSLLGKGPKDQISSTEMSSAVAYWSEVCDNLPDWTEAMNKRVSPADLRQNYIHSHGVAIHALGLVGAVLLQTYPDDWRSFLAKLAEIDWSRSSVEIWEGRALQHGRLSKARTNVQLTANYIKTQLGIPLSEENIELEQQLNQ